MLSEKNVKLGKLDIRIYEFPEIGDELPEHSHDATTVHISIVARGSFKMFGPGWEKVATTGQLLDWKAGQFHGFISLEPNSRLINITK